MIALEYLVHLVQKLEARCDGYDASIDWAIDKLAHALNIEPDKHKAIEYYARLAADEIERMRAKK